MAPKSKRAKPNQPLGAKSSVSTKPVDDDERDLEEAVFGKSTGGRSVWDLAEDDVLRDDPFDDVDFEEERETGLERVDDDNLFFVDVPTASTSKSVPSSGALVPINSGDSSSSDSDSDTASRPPPKPSTSSIIFKPAQNRRKPAWHDPADEELTVSLKSVSRLRKLRTGREEDVVGGLEYEGRLRKQFEKMHPSPSWAVDARRKVMKKRARSGKGIADGNDEESGSDTDEDDRQEEIDDLFRTTSGTEKRTTRRGLLEPGEIDIDRARDANQAEPTSATVVSVGFHPTAQVLFSATNDRRLRLFQIDGTENALLQTLHVPDLPFTTASYHPSGSSILLTGPRPFFVSYDLQTGQANRSPRGLLTGGLGGSDRESTGGAGGLEKAEFSPSGDMLAVGGRRGYVHLIDWGAGGVGNGGQVVGEVKMNVAVKGIAWTKGGKELLTLGEDSEVYVWDVGERKCITRWRDEGGFGACALEVDRNDSYTAVASSTGIVNVYNSSSTVKTSGAERKATKAVGNLTTAVTCLRFNHDSQILALASKTNKDSLKLLHLPSATVFSNWPTQATPLHHVTSVDFSKGSEWLAIGNARGKVLLYSLKSFRKAGR